MASVKSGLALRTIGAVNVLRPPGPIALQATWVFYYLMEFLA